MTKKKHLLDAAFPTVMGAGRYTNGMTLRDYFAGQALAGFMATSDKRASKSETYAGAAYELADAMLEARDK